MASRTIGFSEKQQHDNLCMIRSSHHGSSDNLPSSGEDSPNQEQPVDYNLMETWQQHRPATRNACTTTMRPRRHGNRRMRTPSILQTQRNRPNAARVQIYTNPTGRGSCSLACRRHCPMHLSQCDEVVEDITYTSPQVDPTSSQDVLHDMTNLEFSGNQQHRPRSKQRRKTGTWTDDDMKAALAAVDNGSTMRAASREFHIPYSSLREWCYGERTSRKRGPLPILNPTEEQQLVDYLVAKSDLGCGLTPTGLKLKVSEITRGRWTPFRNGIPGRGWMRRWQRRHPELTVRVTRGLDVARAKGRV